MFASSAFDVRMRASIAAAQDLQGRLDGRWTLYDTAGQAIYVFVIVDPAGGAGPLQAALLDPGDKSSIDAVGVVPKIRRAAGRLRLRFIGHGRAAATTLVLQADPRGGWRGQLAENGARRAVTLKRNKADAVSKEGAW